MATSAPHPATAPHRRCPRGEHSHKPTAGLGVRGRGLAARWPTRPKIGSQIAPTLPSLLQPPVNATESLNGEVGMNGRPRPIAGELGQTRWWLLLRAFAAVHTDE